MGRYRQCKLVSQFADVNSSDVQQIPHQPVKTISDRLLERGIDGYTFVSSSSGGVLGRGKFSSVYKVIGPDGKFVSISPYSEIHPNSYSL
jgi:hypothetical protein